MKFELAVIGSGPAGLSAAIEASKYGVKTVIIDENAKAGGQLFKQIHKFFGSSEHWAGIRGVDIGDILLKQAKAANVKFLLDTTVWGLFDDHRIYIASKEKTDIILADRIVVAAGAYENTVTFPGWTLPGVIGAGAAQTMMNIHRVKPGRKVLMVGSGNVGLIVSYQMLLAGIEVAAIVEFMPNIGGYFVHAAKVLRECVPVFLTSTVLGAEGNDCVEKAFIAQVDKRGKVIEGTEIELEVDAICLSVGLHPRTALLEMLGCRMQYLPELGGFIPVHDEKMETSLKGFYIAGDLSGVEEASTAFEEGRLAGISVAESLGYIKTGDASKIKKSVNERLNDLRLGPFGKFRHDAKKILINSC